MNMIWFNRPIQTNVTRPGDFVTFPNRILQAPKVSGVVGELTLTHNVPMSDIDFSTFFTDADSYEFVDIPGGLAFDGQTGVLSGVPANLGSTSHVVKGVNSYGSTPTNVFSITVQA